MLKFACLKPGNARTLKRESDTKAFTYIYIYTKGKYIATGVSAYVMDTISVIFIY